MFHLRCAARIAAYAIVLLLAAVWLTSALVSLQQPFLDLAKPHVGDAILRFAGIFGLSPDGIMRLANMLVGLKLMIGIYLLAGLVLAIYTRMRWQEEGDELIEVALYLSAIATIVAASPVLAEHVGLQTVVGELLLCAMASGLLMFGRAAPVPATPSVSELHSTA
jgi:hypothetical protein